MARQARRLGDPKLFDNPRCVQVAPL